MWQLHHTVIAVGNSLLTQRQLDGCPIATCHKDPARLHRCCSLNCPAASRHMLHLPEHKAAFDTMLHSCARPHRLSSQNAPFRNVACGVAVQAHFDASQNCSRSIQVLHVVEHALQESWRNRGGLQPLAAGPSAVPGARLTACGGRFGDPAAPALRLQKFGLLVHGQHSPVRPGRGPWRQHTWASAGSARPAATGLGRKLAAGIASPIELCWWAGDADTASLALAHWQPADAGGGSLSG